MEVNLLGMVIGFAVGLSVFGFLGQFIAKAKNREPSEGFAVGLVCTLCLSPRVFTRAHVE